HAGANIWKLRAGAYTELYLADYFKVDGGAFSLDTGRYRILGAGPELKFLARDFEVGLTGRFLLDATKGTNFDYLGNIMGPGVSQGSVSASLSVFL
ncbi:MAG: hypothetical protein HY074_20050, partial [Deltaproteobacteria bacterium]|nr:hypothetical protein [Deltaproteobacteria bacterium]